MSLVAYTQNYGYPTLIGDILISQTDNTSDVEIPVYLSSFPSIKTNQGLFFGALKQKIYIVNNQLAVGLGGLLFEMKNFLADLKNYFRYKETNYSNLQRFLSDYPEDSFRNSFCLAILAEKEGRGIKIRIAKLGEWTYAYSKVFGQTLSVGTGSERFIQEVKEFTQYSMENKSLYLRSKASHNILLCKLIGSEFYSGNSLQDSWGAGLEMITYDGAKFIKNDDTGYLIFDCKIGEQKSFELNPRLAVDYKYYGEVLVNTVNNFKAAKKYGVLGIDQKLEDINLSDIPNNYRFSRNRVVCCIRFILPDETFRISAFLLESLHNTVDDFVKIEINESGFTELWLNEKILRFVENQVNLL